MNTLIGVLGAGADGGMHMSIVLAHTDSMILKVGSYPGTCVS
jgi:hypothetical protein